MRRVFTSPLFWLTIAALLALAFLPLWVSGYILGLLTVAYYFGVFSMAWDLLFGFANEVNFGPTFLIGLGAYTAGILDNRYGLPLTVCIATGTLAAVVGGVVLALPALRVTGPYFGLTTLVAVLILQNLVVVFAGLTGGEIGLTVPDVITIDANVNYWIALGFMTVSGVILFALSRSPMGLILQASGQDAVQVIIAAVIGGRRTIVGAALGAIFLIAMTEALRPTGELATFIVSAIALLVVLFLPNGFVGLLSRGGERP